MRTNKTRIFETAWRKHDRDIVEWNREPCGYLPVEVDATRVDVHELVLHPAYQYRAIGSELLAEVVSLARGLGVPVHLQVLHKNRAVHLYQRLAFEECGRTATHQLMRLNP